jgi:type IV secretory pathway VirB2 component (pilin)
MMLALLSGVGALTVLAFVLFVAVGLLKGWEDATARLLLRIAGGLGIVCAVIAVLLPSFGIRG